MYPHEKESSPHQDSLSENFEHVQLAPESRGDVKYMKFKTLVEFAIW